MSKLTKESPGCIHQLLKALCDKKNIPYKYKVSYKTIEDASARNKSYNVHVIIDGKQYRYYRKRQIKGGVFVYELYIGDTPTTMIASLNIVFDKIWAIKTRTPVEFTPELHNLHVGKYKDSLGGGWYSNVELYKLDDNYYANMECNCF